jgi:uncharacterized SAM-binding protein YcdF (DUF218 family)
MEFKNHNSIENKEKRKYQYDAIIVLSANIKKVGKEEKKHFVPTDLHSPTDMGLAGGGMRVLASTELYLNKEARLFIFSGGKSPRAVAKYGDDIPSDSEVYTEKFRSGLEGLKKRSDYAEKFKDLEEPDTLLEDKSSNTQTNIREVLRLIYKSKWQQVAILTNDYHLPRVQALYEQALRDHPEIKIQMTFLSAEKILKKYQPGKYDKVIENAYKSPDGILRLQNEAKGLEDFKSGKYKIEPFDIAG